MSHITRGSQEVCSLCEGSSIAWDDNPLLPEIKKCNQCNGTGYIKEDKPHCPMCKDTKVVESGIPMVGNEECYYCKDHYE